MKLQGASNFSSDVDVPKPIMSAVVSHAAVVSHSDSIAEMASVFQRSDDAHVHSMDEITASLTLPKAMDVLAHSSFSNELRACSVAARICAPRISTSQMDSAVSTLQGSCSTT